MTEDVTEPPWVCPECAKEVSNKAALKMHRRTHGVLTGWGERGSKPKDDAPPAPDPAPFGAPTEPAKASLKDRLLKGKAEQVPREPGSERKPERPKGRRQDASDLLERLWAWGGRKVEQSYRLPTGRAIQLESPAAGVILDDLVKGTLVDRPVQWVIRKQGPAEAALALIGLPIMVETVCRNPAALPTLAPHIEDALIAIGPSLVKAIRKSEKRRKDFAEVMAGLGPALGKEEGEPVTIEDVFGWLFPQDAPVQVVA